MWWEPTNDYERVLAEDVRSVRSWLIENPNARQLHSFGAGSVWSWYHQALVPTIVMSQFPVRLLAGQAIWPKRRSWLYSLGVSAEERSDRRLPLPYTKLPLHIVVAKEPKEANSTVPSSEISAAMQLTADRIMDAFVRVRDPIICATTRKSGTAGVIAFRHSQPILLTAGHTFAGEGADVLQLGSRKLLGLLRRPSELFIGNVVHHRVPAPNGTADWDVAAIVLNPRAELPPLPLVSRLYQSFQSAEKIRVHGAYSGLVTRAVVQGALTDLGKWKNCWMVAPSGLLSDGDSGAAVFVERDASFLGMYVAQSWLPGSGLPFFHYVQDAFTLQRDALSRWGITFNL